MNTGDIKIINLGSIILWHEEILLMLRHCCANFLQNTAEETYAELGFKPTFYSIHQVDVTKWGYQNVIALSNLNTARLVTKILTMNDKDAPEMPNEIMEKLESMIVKYVENSIQNIYDKTAKNDFTQTRISLQLAYLREKMLSRIME